MSDNVKVTFDFDAEAFHLLVAKKMAQILVVNLEERMQRLIEEEVLNRVRPQLDAAYEKAIAAAFEELRYEIR